MKLSLVLSGIFAILALQAPARADECVDGRVVRIRCAPERVLTSYGCPAREYLVRCAPLKDLPFAQVRVVGVFPVPRGEELSVRRDGRVVYQTWVDRTVNSRQVARLSARKVAELDLAVRRIEPAELPAPEGEMCMDAPTTTYQVVTDSGRVQPIARVAGCRPTSLSDPDGLRVKALLERLLKRARGL